MSEQSESIDTSRPHAARMYDYYLGGKDWFEADRRTAEGVLRRIPSIRTAARANRAFMHRAVRTLTAEHGIRQFLDLGTGIPTQPNLHQIAQDVAADARVVYVDNDPLVVEYADALMRGTPEGRTTYVEADVREPNLLQHPHVREVLDLSRPVAVSLVALLHFVTDAEGPYELTRSLWEPLPSGSFLILSHGTNEFDDSGTSDGLSRTYETEGIDLRVRTRAEIEAFFDGLELLAPGVVVAPEWRPEQPAHAPDLGILAGVARKP